MAQRGGYRPGSGRKLGSKNRIPDEIEDEAASFGMTPLEYMLAVMRDERVDKARRDRMAAAAAPFCHARPTDRAPGKKERATQAAKTAGRDSEWGDDLRPEKPKPN